MTNARYRYIHEKLTNAISDLIGPERIQVRLNNAFANFMGVTNDNIPSVIEESYSNLKDAISKAPTDTVDGQAYSFFMLLSDEDSELYSKMIFEMYIAVNSLLSE